MLEKPGVEVERALPRRKAVDRNHQQPVPRSEGGARLSDDLVHGDVGLPNRVALGEVGRCLLFRRLRVRTAPHQMGDAVDERVDLYVHIPVVVGEPAGHHAPLLRHRLLDVFKKVSLVQQPVGQGAGLDDPARRLEEPEPVGYAAPEAGRGREADRASLFWVVIDRAEVERQGLGAFQKEAGDAALVNQGVEPEGEYLPLGPFTDGELQHVAVGQLDFDAPCPFGIARPFAANNANAERQVDLLRHPFLAHDVASLGVEEEIVGGPEQLRFGVG